MPYEVFWSLNPRKLKSFTEAYKIRRKMVDEQMWYMGMYVQNAVGVAVEHNLAGRKARSKYIDKPILQDSAFEKEEKKEMSHEEKMKQVHAIFASLEARKANWDLQKSLNKMGGQ